MPNERWPLGFCPSCRYMGKIGILVGGIIAGAVITIIKHL